MKSKDRQESLLISTVTWHVCIIYISVYVFINDVSGGGLPRERGGDARRLF